MNSRMRLLTRNLGVVKNHVTFNGGNKFVNPMYAMQAVRQKSSTPINTVVMFVPQQEAWVVERMGKFHRILEPGFNLLVPIIDKVKYVQSLKEIAIDVPQQSAITSDNVTLNIDGVLYLRINDPFLTSYGVADPEFAIIQLAQTTMRSELGKISLDSVFRERESLNVGIVASINKASEAWGITCLRYEIRDIKLPARVQEAMQMQVEAERKKRAAILESEGIRTAEINVAEGKRQARILASEAEKMEQINKASGEASALMAVADARAKSLEMIANALQIHNGKNAAALSVAEQYVQAFNKLAKTNNTLILPGNVSDVSSVVAQAMSIYKHVSPTLNQNYQQIEEAKYETIPGEEQDEAYEYFSDKEEAEKYKKSKKNKKVPS
ncbi:stomatin-like protein 2, mitochondrial [Prorops nasuta]|uniref:stomatin-like protein 2, mitochondrial n=1 Tax=Prorops nasuta TaxID=863751 RepID=UPI0034CDBDAB